MFHSAESQNPKVRNGEQSLRSFGPLVWDTMLPTSFKEIIDLKIFKKAIKIGNLIIAHIGYAKLCK